MSFLGFLGNSLFDFNFFNVVSIQASDEPFHHFWLIGLEGVQMLSLSNFEFCDSLVSLDEDG